MRKSQTLAYCGALRRGQPLSYTEQFLFVFSFNVAPYLPLLTIIIIMVTRLRFISARLGRYDVYASWVDFGGTKSISAIHPFLNF